MKRRRFISLGAGVGAAAMAGFRLRAAKPSDIDLALSNPDAKPEVARQPILVRAGLSRFIDGTEAPEKRPANPGSIVRLRGKVGCARCPSGAGRIV